MNIKRSAIWIPCQKPGIEIIFILGRRIMSEAKRISKKEEVLSSIDLELWLIKNILIK